MKKCKNILAFLRFWGIIVFVEIWAFCGFAISHCQKRRVRLINLNIGEKQ